MAEAFTYEKLVALQGKVNAIPRLPFMASSTAFPADNAIMFTHKGRDYIGAHPNFWDRVPRSDSPSMLQACLQPEIVNLDYYRDRWPEFLIPLDEALKNAEQEPRQQP